MMEVSSCACLFSTVETQGPGFSFHRVQSVYDCKMCVYSQYSVQFAIQCVDLQYFLFSYSLSDLMYVVFQSAK